MISEDALIKRLKLPEDSFTEFKLAATNSASLAQEITAFLNHQGGIIIFGVDDESNDIIGLSQVQAKDIEQRIHNVCRENIEPAFTPTTQFFSIDNKTLLMLEIPASLPDRPFCCDGKYWVRSGSSKRNLSRDELQRIFLAASPITQDEKDYAPWSLESIDSIAARAYLQRHYSHYSVSSAMSSAELQSVFQKIGLVNASGNINLAGAILFSADELIHRSDCMIKAIATEAESISTSSFSDFSDITGNAPNQLKSSLAFCRRNLTARQNGGFNDPTSLEIHPEALEEILVNAIIHRDYGIRATIQLRIFPDRLELVSPGALPNHLDEEKIRNGISLPRNNLLHSHGSKILPYRGLGSGISRLLKHHPDANLDNQRELHQFKVSIPRQERK